MTLMHHPLRLAALILMMGAVCTATAVAAEDPALPTPAQLFDQALGNPRLQAATGEQFTWEAAHRSGTFLTAYEATGSKDTVWLETAQKYYDWCLERVVSNDPDGYPGTIGADIGQDIKRPEVVTVADTLVGDANIALPLVRFAELVRANPALQAQFGQRAQEYIDLATRMVWEKWNHRGCYYEDSRGLGSYIMHARAIAKDDRTRWVERPSHNISDNLNKHYKAGLVLLSLYRLTGDVALRDRVVAIFGRAKAMFRLLPEEDRVVWNFWMPHGPNDISGTAPKSWVGVHPDRAGYQAFEAGAFLSVYDAGLVFDQRDMERIVRTNRWMIENGMKSADGSSKAGTIWGSLAPLDPVILAAYEKATAKNGIARAYLRNVQMKRSGYERTEVIDPKAMVISDVPVQAGRILILAQPIPDVVEIANDDRIRLLACVREAGQLTVELLSNDGTKVLGTLASMAIDPKSGSYAALRWDGTNPATDKKEPGSYLLRWTLNGESRQWPVVVKVGTARAGDDTPPAIARGETLSYDFEQALDARWALHGEAAVGTDQVHAGAKALRIDRKQSATLTFGKHDDLAVRVSLWAFDGGAKHGKASRMGQAIGIRTANGDLFALRHTWRGYLNGDGDWAWINTGENQWFTPHPSGLGREQGWNHWVFDFTADGGVVIERDGKRLEAGRLKPERFVPVGGKALVFMGPDAVGDSAMWIDDVTVTFPAAGAP